MEYLGHNVIIRLIITAINRSLFLMKFPKRSLPVVLPQSHVPRMAVALMLMELSCLKPESTQVLRNIQEQRQNCIRTKGNFAE